jgi:hypothetical protein
MTRFRAAWRRDMWSSKRNADPALELCRERSQDCLVLTQLSVEAMKSGAHERLEKDRAFKQSRG